MPFSIEFCGGLCYNENIAPERLSEEIKSALNRFAVKKKPSVKGKTMDIVTIKNFVEKHKDFILKAERDLWKMPEVGYKEFKTDAYMKDRFRELGYEITAAEGITGFYTVIDTGKEGPTVLVLAELDALYCADHPECDKETKAVHACGHHAQMAAMLGLAAALKEEGALRGLSGKIKLCLVPAEEGIEIEYRLDLIK